MDDETKDYSELDFDNTKDLTLDETKEFSKNEELENTKEVTEEELISVTEQIKEIKKEKINNKIEEIKKEQNNNKKLSKTLIILIIILSILVIGLIIYIIISKSSDKDDNDTNDNKIVIPGNDNEYTIIRQNQIALVCNTTNDKEKIKTLKKGMIIECDFTINTKNSISELFFNLDNSSNLSLKELKNDSGYTLINDKKTYKLTSTTPFNTLKDKIKIYYEVNSVTEKTGYAEIKNIIFKDNNNNYYKMTDNIFAFPPEYEDKIYIYKDTSNEEEYYIGSKASLNEEDNLQLVDTYRCNNEECEVKDNYKSNFIIYDNALFVYDVTQKTKQTIKITDNNFDYNKYEYETIFDKENNLIGVLFKRDYKDNMDCNIIENNCIEKSISGFYVSYYSLDKDMFTVALDYGFIGANIYEDYDLGLLLNKDNKYGIFSYEDDAMILEMSKKYTSIEYDSNNKLVKLGTYDSKNKQTYYTYYDFKSNSYKIDVSSGIFNSLDGSKKIYYIRTANKEGKIIYILFNSQGEPLKDIPYVDPDQIELLYNDTLIIRNNDNFDIYDLNGNFIETSDLIQSGLKVIKTTTSYFLALNKDNKLIITDNIGRTIVALMPSNNLNEIYDVNTMEIVKCIEDNKNLEIIITNPNITEEDKNAYKFNLNSSHNLTIDYINYELDQE